MRVSTYNNTTIERYSGGKNNVEGKSRQQSGQVDSKSASELLTAKERSFFKDLFPDNSEQIEKHVVFNRNGKVNSMNFAKGSIIDGRA